MGHKSDCALESARHIDLDGADEWHRLKANLTSKGCRKGCIEIRASCKEDGDEVTWGKAIALKDFGQELLDPSSDRLR
jgi:hypothetical protein